ncbi:hypothetical protein CEXT_417261 [Caerostris extrusa]|uniref:Uncharacterized protein n=1 Tax=Caerostris extrusa TaxID=172846 RepID=A0AAV4PD42_CAEEX|nr:hypothetical protein CEXT_417261 [Caerostris extrusa]
MIISPALFNNSPTSALITGTSNPSGLALEHKELFGGRFLEQDASRTGINVIATTHNEITGKWGAGQFHFGRIHY